jgi:N-acetylglucosamine-6-phosphate deacetylase
MITITPAVIMGVDSAKGSLTNGKDADMVIFDDHINVHMTVIGGNIIYQR